MTAAEFIINEIEKQLKSNERFCLKCKKKNILESFCSIKCEQIYYKKVERILKKEEEKIENEKAKKLYYKKKKEERNINKQNRSKIYSNSISEDLIKTCNYCGNEFRPKKGYVNFCSMPCKNHKNRKGTKPWNKGLSKKKDSRV